MTNVDVGAIKFPSPRNATDQDDVISKVCSGWSVSSAYAPDGATGLAWMQMDPRGPTKFWLLAHTDNTQQALHSKSRLWERSLDVAESDLHSALYGGSTGIVDEISSSNWSSPAGGESSKLTGDYIVHFPYAPAAEQLDVDPTPDLFWGTQRLCELVSSDSTDQWSQLVNHRFQDLFETTVVEFFDALDLNALCIATDYLLLNGTAPERSTRDQKIGERLERLIAVADVDQFEVGIESQFAKGLQELFLIDPTASLEAVKERLLGSSRGAEVAAEMLRWASRQDDSSIRGLVLDTLIAGLSHSSSLVRDAAALGLAAIDETVATFHLERALESETVPELRDDLEDLLRSFQE